MKTILITGTTRGIGKQLAAYYLHQNYRVVGISRSEATIEHEHYTHHCCDISIEKEVVDTIRKIKPNHPTIDVLINNAAIANMNHLLSTPFDTLKRVSDINIAGTFLMMREVGKQMVKQNKGRIINFTSLSAALNLETQSVYAATKAAVESLTRTAAKELAPFNITVNCIGPTPMDMGLIKGIPQEWLNQVVQMQAIKRIGSMDDIQHVIDFFIDDKASFITGQTIFLGGVNG